MPKLWSQPSRFVSKSGVRNTEEAQRILELPRYRWQDDPEIEALGQYLDETYGLPLRHGCKPRCGHLPMQKACQECARASAACVCRGKGIMTLRPAQVAALQALHDANGMINTMRVGGGKTLVGYLAGSVLGVERTLSLMPAALKGIVSRTYGQLARHWAKPPRVHIMSYELLSRDRGVAELAAFRPDLVVADEGHALKNPRAACSRRMHKYLTKVNPDASYMDMTGTTTNRSILDYHHRVNWALPDGTQFVPRTHAEAQEWAEALDEKIPLLQRRPPGALLQLCTDQEIKGIAADLTKANTLRTVRQAFGRRFLASPGVAGTEELFDGAMGIRIKGHVCTPNKAVVEAFRGLRDTWCLPDGHPIETPIDLRRHCLTLTQGLYHKWDPPPPPEWLILRKLWSAAVRQILKNYRDIDAPMVAARAVDEGRIPWAEEPRKDWRSVRKDYVPHTVAAWLDDTCLDWCAKWAAKNTGVIWTETVHFAEALAQKTGLPYYGQKGLCGKKSIDDETSTCIASIPANHKGRNLQYAFSKNLVVSPPSVGAKWEQLIGRTHREGQDADEVTVDVLLSCYEQWESFRQARRDAEYSDTTTIQCQKLDVADVDVASDAEVEALHQTGDPIWCKKNAEFFTGDERYTEKELTLPRRG